MMCCKGNIYLELVFMKEFTVATVVQYSCDLAMAINQEHCQHGFLGSQEPIDFEKQVPEPIIFFDKNDMLISNMKMENQLL